ncbi:CBASS cGAMP-activated phospholipase [uncultured Aquimarina sp.]|uniref:CBASS cGAMP-activated phospholipase n=1 Tax=uncultured Aquimarina sp. TaxID=575652 RepID=UPI0026390EA4|nr:CBASS cGAMP-activated phospholipase [uncultured Aquimarina sp.]
MNKKKFKILAIDGGGIKGIFPAKLLTLLEDDLATRTDGKTKVYQHFDLITGTSTGGIIALALSLGIPAKEIYNLYLDNAKKIFGNKKPLFLGHKKPFLLGQVFNSAHNRSYLENLVREKFKDANNGKEPRLNDCKTDVCIPIYDLVKGNPSVLKTPYHPSLNRDFHIPAYQAAMATSAAPTYFDPFTAEYLDLNGTIQDFSNKVDGGVMANNPTLVAFIEAIKAFKVDISDLEIFSIGTGYRRFTDNNTLKKKTFITSILGRKKRWGLKYWMVKDKRKRLIELFMQSQSQLVANYISLLHQGIDKSENETPNFVYDRIDVLLNEESNIEMDEFDTNRIKNFAELASVEYQEHRTKILTNYFY